MFSLIGHKCMIFRSTKYPMLDFILEQILLVRWSRQRQESTAFTLSSVPTVFAMPLLCHTPLHNRIGYLSGRAYLGILPFA
jgi:hypothetical protein